MGDRLNLERQRQKGKAKSVIDQEQVAVSSVSSDSTALMQLIQQYIAQHSNEVLAVAASILTCPPQQIRDASYSADTLVITTETCDKVEAQARVGSNAADKRTSHPILEACKAQIMDLTVSDDDDDNDFDEGKPSTSHSHMQGRGGSGKESMKGSAEKASTVTSECVRGIAKEAAQAQVQDDVTAFWTCSTCTCVNPALVKFCEACLQPLSKNSTAVTATAGKGKRRQSVKNEKQIKTEITTEVKTELKAEGAARSATTKTNKMKTLKEVRSLHDIDLNRGVIHCLDSDSDGDGDDNGDGHCQILHDETRKNAGAVSGRGLMKFIGPSHTQAQTEQGSREGSEDREGSEEGALLLPEPLPLLLIPTHPTAASEPSHVASPDTLLDANSELLVDLVSYDRSNNLSVHHSTRSIHERFAAFGYDYPSTRLDLSDLALLKLTGPDSTVRARMPGTDSLYSSSSTSEKSRSCDEAATCISDDQFHWIWDPDCCVVFGKRYGDPKRKGKSKFCGRDDEMVSVETFVRQKCQIVEPDDTNSFCAAVDGGGWQGWHCEGSVLRTLFGLLMWDQMFSDHPDVFLTPYQDAPLDLNFPNFVRTRLDDITQRVDWLEQQTPVALIRAVGDSYRAHYRHRCRGVNWMHKLHTLQLIAVCLGGRGIAGVCRALAVNYKKFSSGTPDLLLIRVSRPRECSSPSNKTTGAADDLAVAVAGDRDSEEGERGRGRSRDKDRNRDREGGRDRSRDRDRDGGRGREACRDRGGPPECLDIADILGCDWDVLIDAGDDSNEGQEGSTKSLDQGKKDQDDREGEADALIQNSAPSIAPYRDDSSSVKTKGRYNKWRKRKTQDADNDDLQSLGRTKRELADAGQLSAKASMKVPAVSIFHTLKRRLTESLVVVDISDDADIDADADEILLSETRSVTFQQVNNVPSKEDVLHSHTVGEDENACVDADSDPATEQAVLGRAPSSSPSLDRFVCTLADLILPLNDVSSSTQHSSRREGSAEDCSHSRHLPQSASEQAVSGQMCSRGSVHEGWKYECMMVEVKGPTDSLADHQLMWLCVLSSSSVATFVAHIKETSLIE